MNKINLRQMTLVWVFQMSIHMKTVGGVKGFTYFKVQKRELA
jgi:hypothetical protein